MLAAQAVRVRLMTGREEWLANLQAERVTHSHESFKQVMARLDMERPESPESMRIKAAMRMDHEVARHLLEILALVHAPKKPVSYLEKRLGRTRLALAMSEMEEHERRTA